MNRDTVAAFAATLADQGTTMWDPLAALRAIEELPRGGRFVYHRGFLIDDRTSHRTPLHALAEMLYSMATRPPRNPAGHLIQRRMGERDYVYIFEKR